MGSTGDPTDRCSPRPRGPRSDYTATHDPGEDLAAPVGRSETGFPLRKSPLTHSRPLPLASVRALGGRGSRRDVRRSLGEGV